MASLFLQMACLQSIAICVLVLLHEWVQNWGGGRIKGRIISKRLKTRAFLTFFACCYIKSYCYGWQWILTSLSFRQILTRHVICITKLFTFLLCFRHFPVETCQRGWRSRLSLHQSAPIRAGHFGPEVRGTRRVPKVLLRHQPRGHHQRSQVGEDMRPQPAPTVTQDAQELQADAIRRLCSTP